jgi:hypothetical protein
MPVPRVVRPGDDGIPGRHISHPWEWDASRPECAEPLAGTLTRAFLPFIEWMQILQHSALQFLLKKATIEGLSFSVEGRNVSGWRTCLDPGAALLNSENLMVIRRRSSQRRYQ